MSEKQTFIKYVKAMEEAILDMPVFISEVIDMEENDIEIAKAYLERLKREGE